MKIKIIHFIINPAAGKCEPILPVINEVFKDTDIRWEVSVTQKSGDAGRFAKESADKADLIAVYGGDGTVMEALNGVLKASAPLAILPGGTGNVMAVELGIPFDLKEACELIAGGKWELKSIDLAKFQNRNFILRTGMGFEAEMVKGADRGVKNRWGRLAYVVSGIAALKKIRMVKYTIEVDGKEHSTQGLQCVIANAGSVGFGDLTLEQKISPSDGKLDVIVLKKLHISLLRYIYRILVKGRPSSDRELVAHYQGQEIKITSKPAQAVICDGETLGKIEVHAKIIPRAVKILVPAGK